MKTSIKLNLDDVLYKINESKQKSIYNQDVKLVAVSKTVGVDKIKEAIDYGILDFGENKVQELVRKHQVYPKVKWHQIGTLQKNKVKQIIDKVEMIHSLDSFSLADEIDKRSKDMNLITSCLIQINISNEDTKHGINSKNLFDFVKIVSESNANIKLLGLMGMAPYEEDNEKTRPYFQKMKELFTLVNSKNINGVKLKHLSMGMSNDYDIAVEEGSTIVRVGTNIFGNRIYI